jgi:hypothetical protein
MPFSDYSRLLSASTGRTILGRSPGRENPESRPGSRAPPRMRGECDGLYVQHPHYVQIVPATDGSDTTI